MRILATLAIGAALMLGCGESRQEKFERALRDAEAARVGLESAREQLQKSESDYEDAQRAAERAEAQLASARSDLDAASERLDAARAEVLKWAPDGALPPEMQPSLPVPHSASDATSEPSAIEH